MRLWRISDFADLSGIGGQIAPGRWHSKGRHIVYAAESSALAMLEVLVGLELGFMPPSFQLIQIDAPDDLETTEYPADADLHDQSLMAAWGDAFLRAGATPLARVPSAVAPYCWNYLLNPFHPQASRVSIARAERWPWDERLFRG